MPTPNEVVDALSQNLDDIVGLVDQIVDVIVAGDAEQARLRAEIANLLAGDAAMAAKVSTAFDKSEAAENKLRAAVPGVPPVGGTPLLPSYASKAEFDTAWAAYTGPEAVTLDGTEVKSGSTPAIDYFTHSADGSVTIVGPSD
jgi:hypothetical protein